MAATAVAALVAGCNAPRTDTGGVDVSVVELSSADVTSVSVTITRPGYIYNQVAQLTQNAPGTWGATVGSIPVATGYTFSAAAVDSQGHVLYQGATSGVEIKATSLPALVTINAQQATPPLPFNDTMPVIDAFVASANVVAPGDVITATVTVHDPDAGDTIMIAWSANPAVGVFSAPGSATTNWTAPATEGSVTLTVAVTDSSGATASSSLVVQVLSSNGRGEASTTVTLNTWPVITNVTATPSFVTLGQPISLAAVASDSDGDPLTYAWTSTCASGSLSAPSAGETTFTLPPGAVDTSCTMDVVVQDNRGGSTHGQTTLPVGAPANLGGPIVTLAVQPAAAITAGGTATLAVEATDPQGSALTFAWQASGGTLSGQNDTAGSSQVTWTAPTTGSASFTISAVVTDAMGLATQHDLAIQTAQP
jgi:hypothetical protein